jgi:hypothetical protein
MLISTFNELKLISCSTWITAVARKLGLICVNYIYLKGLPRTHKDIIEEQVLIEIRTYCQCPKLFKKVSKIYELDRIYHWQIK